MPEDACPICGTANCTCKRRGTVSYIYPPIGESWKGFEAMRMDVGYVPREELSSLVRTEPPTFVYIDKDYNVVDAKDPKAVTKLSVEDAKAQGIVLPEADAKTAVEDQAENAPDDMAERVATTGNKAQADARKSQATAPSTKAVSGPDANK